MNFHEDDRAQRLFDIFPKVKNLSLPDEYIYKNGGRDFLLKLHKLDADSILNSCKEFYE